MAAPVPGDRDLALLGIKYEAAKLGGVDGAALASIVGQMRDEAGEGWKTNAMVLRGRNAVREEHGLPRLGEPQRSAGVPGPARRSLLRRIFGR